MSELTAALTDQVKDRPPCLKSGRSLTLNEGVARATTLPAALVHEFFMVEVGNALKDLEHFQGGLWWGEYPIEVGKKGHVWIQISCSELSAELGITYNQVKTAIRKLTEAKLLWKCARRSSAWTNMLFYALGPASFSSDEEERRWRAKKRWVTRDD